MLTKNKVFDNFSVEDHDNNWGAWIIAKYNLKLITKVYDDEKVFLKKYKLWDNYKEAELEFRIASLNLSINIGEHEDDHNNNLDREYNIGMYKGKLLRLKRGEIN